MLLDSINQANDIKNVKREDLPQLAREIRGFLIKNVSRTGGHLASNLGAVELTMALHLALDLPNDKIVWDVGHQAYVHKLLTGRKEMFPGLRTYGGLSGFPKRRESECDAFIAGHASTAISAAVGMAEAEVIKGENNTIVAVVGDGALTGGMAYEAINNASKLDRNLIIILNDNNRSISENVGGMSSHLTNLRAGGTYNDIKQGVVNTLERIPVVGDSMVKNIKKTKDKLKTLIVPGSFFENLGITYLGPIDGHNIARMRRVITESKKLDHPVIIHVCTKKGKGYKFAEKDPGKFHGIAAFDPKTGELKKKALGPTWTKVFADTLESEAEHHANLVAITAAMTDGTGLKDFSEKYPDRFFDVGIAEEHAVTSAAGMASEGMKPFVAIYSTFLQRAFDQILHDVCLQNLPVTFCIDRAGLVGEDGETHQGTFDISYMSTIPNMNVFAPKNGQELEASIKFAAAFSAPLAIRYPRGEAFMGLEEFNAPIEFGKSEIMYLEKNVAILAVGSMVSTACEVRERLKAKGVNVSLVNVRFVKPIDEEMLRSILKTHQTIITMEENVLAGGFGVLALSIINSIRDDARVINFAVPNSFIEQGSKVRQLKECGLDADSMTRKLCEILELEQDEKET